MAKKASIIPIERIQQCIYLFRGQKVMLDKNLAALYGVTTKRLNEQVQRNIERFPSDFMIQLNDDETKVLRSQFATSKKGRGGRRYNPYAFTEQGVAMLSSVLRSKRLPVIPALSRYPVKKIDRVAVPNWKFDVECSMFEVRLSSFAGYLPIMPFLDER